MSFAIIATTVVLVAVFVPLIFIKGITGVLFTQTAITLASAVIISSFVALSLSPMLASKFLQRDMKKSKTVLKFENFLKDLTYLYKVSLLEWIKRRKTITIFLLSTLVLSSLILFLILQKRIDSS